MSLVSWLDLFITAIALLLLAAAGLVEATHARKQRLTIRDILESERGEDGANPSVNPATLVRSAVDVAALLSVLIIGVALTRFGMREFGWAGTLLTFGVGVGAILLFGRVLPVAIAERFITPESRFVHMLGSILGVLVAPFTLLADLGIALIERLTDRNGAETATNGDRGGNGDTRDASDSGIDDIEDDEHEMISGILSMEDATAREIMVPRPDVIAVPIDASVAEVVRVAQQGGHSRIPVYRESIDRVEGIVYAKDLLRFVSDDVEGVHLRELVRPAMFVPESKRVDDLLTELRRSRVHMAIVVDEYGGTAGIVTIEDILEEIVGEIQDEYDRELPLYQFGTTGEVTVDGRMSVEELSEVIGIDLPETESETIGGFVQRELGRIPEAGETIQVGSVAIRVESVERRRVRTLRVTLLEQLGSVETADPMRAG